MQCLTYIRSSVAFGLFCGIFIHYHELCMCKHFFLCWVVCWCKTFRCRRLDKYQKCEEISLFKLASRWWSSELNVCRPSSAFTPTNVITSSRWNSRQLSQS